jgi:hypothetical protein
MKRTKVWFRESASSNSRTRSVGAALLLAAAAVLLGSCLASSSASNARAADTSSSSTPRMSVTGPGSADIYVLTQHNDLGRTGVNPSEALLTPAAVNNSSFGELWRLPVDGQINAQPLYVGNARVVGQNSLKNLLN